MRSPSASPPPRPAPAWALACLLAAAAAGTPRPAPAQGAAKPDEAAGVFDDEAPAREPEAKTKAKAPGARAANPKAPAGGAVAPDAIGFSQENVAAQMAELEERMFRLSEALRGLEPENASRLRLALKFSREEQILDQMRETHKLLNDAQIGKAETEVRELVAKLDHLRNLLLAEDLDFQLKMARLRQTRETLAQLDRIVKEEKRELGWSRFAVDQRKALERLNARRPDLEALVRDQQAVIADTKDAAGKDAEAARTARAAVRDREATLRKGAAALASDPVFSDQRPAHLRQADPHLGDALGHLEGADTDTDAALAAEDRALALFRRELARLDDQAAQAKATVADAEFRRREKDQAKNRAAADALGVASARLGDVGVALRKDLIRAGGSMRSAEQGLEKAAAGPAADDQSAALDLLAKSRDDLARSAERLLVEIRTELQARLIAELTEMHELQASIRESTEAQAPRVARKSRAALIAVGGLSKQEGALGLRTEHLLALAEETDFGIALPTALRVLGREMRSIEGWLKAGDASARTVALELRVEEDLLGMLQAVRRLPPGTPPPPGTPLPSDPRERERELNRMIAELKMVRMLQSRLNDDTAGVDGSRPGPAELTPALRREVEALEANQDEIRDSLAKIAERLEDPDNPQ